MFWNSVVEGLKVLLYWEVYVAGLGYITLSMIPIIVAGMIGSKSESTSITLGCLSMIIVPMFQVVAMAVMILTLAPIIFGLAEDAAWSLPWQLIVMAPGAFFTLIGILVVTAIVLALIPGQLKSLHTLILGGITLTFFLGILDLLHPDIVIDHVELIPGFWFSAGLIAIGGAMFWIGMMITMALSMVAYGMGLTKESLEQLMMFPAAATFGAIFGFIPVFMYGAWIGAQIRSGF